MEKCNKSSYAIDSESQPIKRFNRPAFLRLYMFLLELQKLQRGGEKFSKTELAKKYGLKARFEEDLTDLRKININEDFVKTLYIQRREYRRATEDWKTRDTKSSHFNRASARMKDFLISVKGLQEGGVYPKGVHKMMTDCRIGIFPMSI